MKKRILLLPTFLFLCALFVFLITSDSSSTNKKPIIIPEIRKWTGQTGHTDLLEMKYIFYSDERYKTMATLLQEELLLLSGIDLEIIYGIPESDEEYKKSIFLLDLSKDADAEAYTISISPGIVIAGVADEGVFWGTRTFLQMVSQSTLIPNGIIEDSPSYEVRGLGIDVARKPVSVETLKDIIVLMSWYKMNDLHLHLNDNALMSYVYSDYINAYSAFRLESSIHNDNGEYLSSNDYHYTKEEFAELIQFANKYHVNIIPEIDTPSHALAITKVFPELTGSITSASVDSLNLSNPEALQLVKKIWDEYIPSVFTGCKVVHIGLDESFTNPDLYYKYADELSSHVISQGKTVRAWGSLSRLVSDYPLNSDNVQLNIWKTVWANPQDMLDKGFDIINTQSHQLYIIPGGGYDYLDTKHLYNSFQPNIFEAEEWDGVRVDDMIIDPENEQLLGASMFVWNDMACDMLDLNINEYDIYHRILNAVPYFAQKVWGTNCQYAYEEFSSNITLASSIPNAEYLLPNTDTSKAVLTPPYRISFDVTLASITPMTLFENKAAYGIHSLSLEKDDEGYYLSCDTEYRKYDFVQYESGKSKYYLDDLIEADIPFHVMVTADMGTLQITLNDQIVLDAGSNNVFEQYATYLFPMEQKNDAVSNVKIE